MLLLIVYNQRFLLYCVLKKLNCDDFVLFFCYCCCGYCLLLSLKKVMVKKKFPPSFFSQWNTYLKVFSANQI